jgi:NAD(P)-dependent dehydrogenase (short-subunit alcohol dehydrogenase family)
MRTIALTGSASGIGAATRKAMEADGDRVIGVDLRDAEVVADLGTAEGRAAAVAGVLAACDGTLDGYGGFAGVPATVDSTGCATRSPRATAPPPSR